MEFGPDGALYVLEYGDGYFSENPEAQLVRIDYVRGNRTPVPQVAADVTAGLAPLTVHLLQRRHRRPRRRPDRLRVGLRRRRRGRLHRPEPDVHLHRERRLRRDAAGHRLAPAARPRRRCVIVVGNAVPVVELTTSPAPGEPFSFGQTVTFTVTVTDDTPVDCCEGDGDLHPRPQRARPPAVLVRRVHRLDHDVRGLRARRCREPARPSSWPCTPTRRPTRTCRR